MRRALLIAGIGLGVLGSRASAQDTLRVEQLQEEAVRSDPRSAQRALLQEASDLRLAVIGADRLPQLSLHGQATHQSDVPRPSFGVPGLAVPDFPKDRWQTTLDLEQRLYDGGDVARRRELEVARHAESEAALQVSLYQLRSDVNSAFFAAFLFEQRAAEYQALVGDLEARLTAVRARVEAGTALGRDAAAIEAERVRAELQRDEARASRRAALATLADLTGRPIDTTAVLALTPTEPEQAYPGAAAAAALRRRPEFEQLQRSRLRSTGRSPMPAPRTGPGSSPSGRPAWGSRAWTSSAPRATRSGRPASRSSGAPGPGAPPAGPRPPSGSSSRSSPPKSRRWDGGSRAGC
jgi:outer membrane protein TolC